MASRIRSRVARRGRLEDDPGIVAEGHDRDAVVAAELVDEDAQGVLDESSRSSRSIEPEVSMTKVSEASWRARSRDLARLEPDPDAGPRRGR